MVNIEDYTFDQNPLAFFAVLGLLNGVGLILILLNLFQQGVSVLNGATIFLLLYLFSHAIQIQVRNQIPDGFPSRYIDSQFAPAQHMAVVFSAGFGFWYLLQVGKQSASVLGGRVGSIIGSFPTMEQNVLFASAVEQASNPAYQLFATVISAPFVEEFFFIGALPPLIWILGRSIGIKDDSLLAGFVLGVVSVAFAYFHVGQTERAAFLVAAIIFSAVIRGFVLFDFVDDVVPGVAVLVSFAIGAHMANNMYVTGGIGNFVSVIQTEPSLYLLFVSAVGFILIWDYQWLAQQFNALGGD